MAELCELLAGQVIKEGICCMTVMKLFRQPWGIGVGLSCAIKGVHG